MISEKDIIRHQRDHIKCKNQFLKRIDLLSILDLDLCDLLIRTNILH